MTDKKTILIIDDEPDTFIYFSTLLEDNGYKTIGAENGDEGLERVKESAPDLITMDITMPKMSGVKAYRTLKEDDKTKAIPIIIITGISDDFKEFISSRKRIPAPDGYLSKPINEDEFLAMVAKLTS